MKDSYLSDEELKAFYRDPAHAPFGGGCADS